MSGFSAVLAFKFGFCIEFADVTRFVAFVAPFLLCRCFLSLCCPICYPLTFVADKSIYPLLESSFRPSDSYRLHADEFVDVEPKKSNKSGSLLADQIVSNFLYADAFFFFQTKHFSDFFFYRR